MMLKWEDLLKPPKSGGLVKKKKKPQRPWYWANSSPYAAWRFFLQWGTERAKTLMLSGWSLLGKNPQQRPPTRQRRHHCAVHADTTQLQAPPSLAPSHPGTWTSQPPDTLPPKEHLPGAAGASLPLHIPDLEKSHGVFRTVGWWCCWQGLLLRWGGRGGWYRWGCIMFADVKKGLVQMLNIRVKHPV